MAECSVSLAMSRIESADRTSRIAVFLNPEKPWFLNTVFDATFETRKWVIAGHCPKGGQWVGSFCRDDFQEVVKRVLEASVLPEVKKPTVI